LSKTKRNRVQFTGSRATVSIRPDSSGPVFTLASHCSAPARREGR